MSTREEWTGGCLCGAVRFQAQGNPDWVAICHCGSCRRHTGGALNAAAGFPAAKVSFQGKPSVYASSPGVERYFCPQCGTSIAYQSRQWPEDLHLFVGSFDHPQHLEPECHIHAEDGLAWLKLADQLPRFRTTPSAGDLIEE